MSAPKMTTNEVVAKYSIPKIQPPTKTSVGRLTYDFDSLPKLLIVQVETRSNGEHCKSKRLRNKAIREFMKRDSNFKNFEKLFAVRFWATKLDANSKVTPVDHLILQVSDDTDLQSFRSRTFITCDTKLHVRQSGNFVQHPVILAIKTNGNPINENDESYWANLDFLLRTYMSGTCPKSEYGLDREFFVADTVVNRPENFANLTKSWFPIFVRNQPRIENKKFVLDFDIVPGITPEQGNVAELVFRYFGKRTGGPDLVHNLPMIKRMLVGLNVTTDYRFDKNSTENQFQSPLKKISGNRLEKSTASGRAQRVMSGSSDISSRRGSSTENEIVLNSDPKGKIGSFMNQSGGLMNSTPTSPNTPQSPSVTSGSKGVTDPAKFGHNVQCIIQDIKLPGDVPTFFKDGKKFSVLKYFNEEVYGGSNSSLDLSVNYPMLPFAKIGRDAWIPIEMLKITNCQILKGWGAFTKDLQEAARRFWEADGQSRIQKYGDKFIRTTLKKDQKGFVMLSGAFVSAGVWSVSKQTVVAPARTQRALRKTDLQDPKLTFGIIHVAPSQTYVPFDHTSRSQTSDQVLAKFKATLRSFESDVLNMSPDEPMSATITDTKVLLLDGSKDYPRVQDFRKNGKEPDVLFGIIDTKSRSKDEIRNIRADIIKFGNRKVGRVTHCITKESVEKMLQDRDSGKDYFPSNILRKIRFMRGGINFETNALNSIPKKRGAYMVVGAHISHPGSSAANHCPSVASVVASTQHNPQVYPGSARVQPTLHGTLRKVKNGKQSNKIEHDVQSNIVDLETMMVERFEAWKGNQPKVLFYRDSAEKNDTKMKALENVEMEAICNAYVRVFNPADTETVANRITYIIVNKYTANPYIEDKESKENNSIVRFTTESLTEKERQRVKYQYHVMHNGLGFNSAQFSSLTQDLNKSSQLYDKVSLALPVFWAHKLCDRMFDYFRYCITNEFDYAPPIRRTMKFPEDEAHKNDTAMTELVHAYLTKTTPASTEPQAQNVWSNKNPWPPTLDDTMFYL